MFSKTWVISVYLPGKRRIRDKRIDLKCSGRGRLERVTVLKLRGL